MANRVPLKLGPDAARFQQSPGCSTSRQPPDGKASFTTREFPSDRATIDIGSYHADDSAFRAATDWVPKVGLEEGIGRTIEWYRTRLASYL